jgi:RsiW-degrading membrane proteinase PrsW (M82 family)
MAWVFYFSSMNNGTIFLIFSAFAAIVSAALWLDYFRRIDVFEKESIRYLLITLAIGGFTPYISLFIYGIFERLGFSENGRFFNDFLYSIFGIGLNEEFSKIVGVIFVFTFLKKQINEPIDILIYAGVTALGFSMVENYHYFNNHGLRIITSRTFYSALEHIINTSIIVYGFYRYTLFKRGSPIVNTTVAVCIAVVSHGLFDFFLTDNVSVIFTAFLATVIYLVGINFWIQMLNNANNFSSFFDYDKIHYSKKLETRLFAWYALTLVIAFVNNLIVMDLKFSFITLVYSLISDGFLFFVVILRVSRFKIFKFKYFKVKLAFPFYVTKNQDEDFIFPFIGVPIKIRGENYQEHLLTKYLGRKIELNPMDYQASFLNEPLEATITNKLLLFDDVIVYTIAVPGIAIKSGMVLLLKPRTSGETMVNNHFPVVGLFEVAVPAGYAELPEINYKKLVFLEWVYLKSYL